MDIKVINSQVKIKRIANNFHKYNKKKKLFKEVRHFVSEKLNI